MEYSLRRIIRHMAMSAFCQLAPLGLINNPSQLFMPVRSASFRIAGKNLHNFGTRETRVNFAEPSHGSSHKPCGTTRVPGAIIHDEP